MAQNKRTKTKKGLQPRGSTKFPATALIFSTTNLANPKRRGSKSFGAWAFMSKHVPCTVGYLEPLFNKWANRTEFHSSFAAELTWNSETHSHMAITRDGQNMPKAAFNKGELLHAGAEVKGTTVTYQPGEKYTATKEPEAQSDDSDQGDEEAEAEQDAGAEAQVEPTVPGMGVI